MTILNRVVTTLSSIAFIAGAVVAIEARYAHAEELTKKADKADLKVLHIMYLEDKWEELKVAQYKISQVPEESRTPTQKFELQQVQIRLERIQRKLDLEQ